MINTNINELATFIDNTTISKHFNCCENVFLDVSVIINKDKKSKVKIVIPFGIFEDINDNMEIYRIGYEQFFNMINDPKFELLFNENCAKELIDKLKQQN